MRAFAACLTVVLGFGAFSVVACSSDATTTTPAGEAGEAGAPSSPAAGGGGATGTAGGTGDAGSCSFASDPCQTCLATNCLTEASACQMDTKCDPLVSPLEVCACDPTKTIAECTSTFKTDGGSAAADLVTCYNANCTADCQ